MGEGVTPPLLLRGAPAPARGAALQSAQADFASCWRLQSPQPAVAPRAVSRGVYGAHTSTHSVAPRPNVSGVYISSARGGGTTKVPGVVARASYV
jgi:hypothetical protein